MRKLFLLTSLLAISVICFAKDDKDKNADKAGFEEVTYLGVDFSMTKTFACPESPESFIDMYSAINNLIVSDQKKYDIEKATGKKLADISISAIEELNKAVSVDNLKASTPEYEISEAQLANHIKSYKLDKKSGVGFVLVGEMLNKSKKQASYYAVYFDMATRNILVTRKVEGAPGGFGLRNYWAASIYRVMKRKSI